MQIVPNITITKVCIYLWRLCMAHVLIVPIIALRWRAAIVVPVVVDAISESTGVVIGWSATAAVDLATRLGFNTFPSLVPKYGWEKVPARPSVTATKEVLPAIPTPPDRRTAALKRCPAIATVFALGKLVRPTPTSTPATSHFQSAGITTSPGFITAYTVRPIRPAGVTIGSSLSRRVAGASIRRTRSAHALTSRGAVRVAIAILIITCCGTAAITSLNRRRHCQQRRGEKNNNRQPAG